MDQPKDYYEYYHARFSKQDMDDTWIDGVGIGTLGTALLFVLIIAACKWMPIF